MVTHTQFFAALCVAGGMSLPDVARAAPPPDFNGDGYADLAVGAPGEGIGHIPFAGAVTVIYGSSDKLRGRGSQTWWLEHFGVNSTAGALFGANLAWGDINNDGLSDLAIGVPGQQSVVIMYGAAGGLTPASRQFLSPSDFDFNSSPCTDSWFGGTLAVGDFNEDSYHDLAVGAPLCFVKGRVFAYRGGPGGLFRDRLLGIHNFPEWNYDMPMRFGSALAAGDFNGDGRSDLAVGIPSFGFYSAESEEGAVGLYRGVPTTSPGRNLLSPSRLIFQGLYWDSAANEANDRFGEVLAAGDFDNDGYDDLAVGVPLEDLGLNLNAGTVSIFRGVSAFHAVVELWEDHPDWSQNSESLGVALPDIAERGDHFGAALGVGDFNGDGAMDLAIGVPGENAGAVARSGAVHVLHGGSSGLQAAGNRFFHQNSRGVLDASEPGDAFGSSLTAGDYDGNGYDDLAVGVPGENLTIANQSGQLVIVEDAGAVAVIYTWRGVLNHDNQLWSQRSAGVPGAPEAGDVFGAGRYGHQ